MALLQISLFSQSLGMATGVQVILPQSPEGRTDVLYLLHGMQGDHTDWVRRTNIERYVADKNLTVVMPSVLNSSYANMIHGQKFYDYIAKELPGMLQHALPITLDPARTYICGLSMGGRGSMQIGLSNPERYGAVGCLSAGRRFFRREEKELPFTPPRRENHSLKPSAVRASLVESIHGTEDPDTLIAQEDAFFQAVEQKITSGVKMPRFFHACGTEDPLLPGALAAKAWFEAHPAMDYTYREGPGGHTWAFWDTYIQEFLKWLGN